MLEIIAPALLVGLLIALSHGLLGLRVLQKNIIFIDLAIAQIAGFGLVVAHLFFEHSHFYDKLIPLIFALCAGGFFYHIEKKNPKICEAIIGCSFVVAASLTILLLADHAHGDQEIKHLLSGQILFVDFKDLIIAAPIYLGFCALWFLKPTIQNGLYFYLIFSVIITLSVSLVGVYLVFASLILPALAAFNKKKPILFAWMCGFLSIFSGIICAAIFDLPAGVLLVVFYAIFAILLRFTGNFQ